MSEMYSGAVPVKTECMMKQSLYVMRFQSEASAVHLEHHYYIFIIISYTKYIIQHENKLRSQLARANVRNNVVQLVAR